MKKVWFYVTKGAAILAALAAVWFMVFAAVSALFVDQIDRNLFGYRAFVVLSDSMSATDFSAGDIIVVKEAETETLKSGDIIAFISTDPSNYGVTVSHKIKRPAVNQNGEYGFITYSTTTGREDQTIAIATNILGKYQFKIPWLGRLFEYLRSTNGYLLFILVPFLALLSVQCVKLFHTVRSYRSEAYADIRQEREMLALEREQTKQMIERYELLRNQIESSAAVPFQEGGDEL